MAIDRVKFTENTFDSKKSRYCLCIPVINEGERILTQLATAKLYNIDKLIDIIICDGGSTDGSIDEKKLKSFGVNTLLIKKDNGRLSAQLRMGYLWAIERGYDGIVTIDGNGKDSIDSVPLFIQKLDEGYDFIQGSRFIKGGRAVNTPLIRHIAVKFIHAPLISFTAKEKFTDTTNGFRGYSKRYLTDHMVQPFRNIFNTYELLAYLSVRASQLGMRVCEVPVTRTYPKEGKTPTKISKFSGNSNLIKILIKNFRGDYNPNEKI